MKSILFNWELGYGLGHIIPIAQCCAKLKNYRVFVALRDLEHAFLFHDMPHVKILRAPSHDNNAKDTIESPFAYAHLLHNCGFQSKTSLTILVKAWTALYELIKPDIVVFDHSPSALVAAHRFDFKKFLVGSGFLCPPIATPFGVFFSERITRLQSRSLAQFENQMLEKINSVLDASNSRKIARISDIYSQADQTLISGYPETDHFPNRNNGRYIGTLPPSQGSPVRWPKTNNSTRKVFFYSHIFQEFYTLIDWLNRSEYAVSAYFSSVSDKDLKEIPHNNIHLARETCSLSELEHNCDFAVTNGNFNTASQLALLGIPQICIPIQKDQLLFTQTLKNSGLCIAASPHDFTNIVGAFDEMEQRNEEIKANCLALSEKYKKSGDPLQKIICAIEGKELDDQNQGNVI